MYFKLKSSLSTNSKSIWYWISSKLADSLIASLMVFQITHEIKFNLTCEWLSNSAVHFIWIKIWPAIPWSNFFSYWLLFPSFFRNKKSNWFVVVDVKCVAWDFTIFCFLEMKKQRQNLFVNNELSNLLLSWWIFIGPRSDHSLPMSLTDSLTDKLVEDLMNWPLLMETNI